MGSAGNGAPAPCPHRVQVLVTRRRRGDVIARCVACGRIVRERQEGQW